MKTMTKATFGILSALLLLLAFSSISYAKDWEVESDSVELTGGDIDRPYEIKEIVSFVLKRDLPEESMKEAHERLKKAASDKGCDAVIFVDHYTERDPTELFTNAILVQTLDSTEYAERRKKWKSHEEVAEKVKKREILLSEDDIDYPYEIEWIADVISPDGSAASMSTVDGLLSDFAREKRGHAVIFINYDRAGTQVDGAKGIIIRFPRKWLRSGEMPDWPDPWEGM